MLKPLLFFCGSLLALSAHTQPMELAGIINTYHEVTDLDSCSATLTTALPLPYTAGDTLLLYQAQGATIRLDDNADFGTLIDRHGAGYHELVVLRSVNGAQVELQHYPRHAYQPGLGLQLVSLPSHPEAIVTDTLRCQAWNGVTGGLLALRVHGQLTLEAPIKLDGSGFRGGQANTEGENNCSFLSNPNDRSYPLGNWRGAAKGEGIVRLDDTYRAGRGPAANAGGGGNDHNAGGGGGSLVQAGGRGGENNEPTTFGCKGRFPGEGGQAMGITQGRWIMGGGGGAGHGNNAVAGAGGNGGGVALLRVGRLRSQGHTISSRGSVGSEGAGDGSGGGGAAGTVALFTDELDDALRVDLRGGDGGSHNNLNQERCMGPGGGGAAGLFLTTHSMVLLNVLLEGGQAGTSYNSLSCPDATNGAQPGAAGASSTLQEPLKTGTPYAVPAFQVHPEQYQRCAGQLLQLTVPRTGSGGTLQWQADTGSGYVNLLDDGDHSGSQSDTLLLLAQNDARYRLIWEHPCVGTLESGPIFLTVIPAPSSITFSSAVDGFSWQGSALGSDTGTWEWDFGDGHTATGRDAQHTYAATGTYTITLRLLHPCDTLTHQQMIELALPPTATFSSSPAGGCVPFEVDYTAGATVAGTTWRWIFVGGTPSTAQGPSVTTTYTQPGSYAVTLQAVSAGGSDEITYTNYVQVLPRPLPDFLCTLDGLSVSCTNNSQQANSYSWSTGDGGSYTSEHLEHTFSQPGYYTLTLNAFNSFCGATTSQQLQLIISNVTDENINTIQLFPNPTDGRVYLRAQSLDIQQTTVYNSQGRALFTQVPQGDVLVSLEQLPAGIYWLRIAAANGSLVKRIVRK